MSDDHKYEVWRPHFRGGHYTVGKHRTRLFAKIHAWWVKGYVRRG